MHLLPREIDKLMIAVAADLARRRKEERELFGISP
ncbi:urease subunit gamma [Bacillus sp. JJ1566]